MQPSTTPALTTKAATTPVKPAVITPESLEAAQAEADYDAHLEERMGRYGY